MFLGIDLGASSLKAVLVDKNGKILAQASEQYEVTYPQSGWTEQNPEDWYSALSLALPKLLDGQDKQAVKGISFGGQMHGLVVLNKQDEVIRPCILWNDGRTQKQTDYLNSIVGKEKLIEYTGNIAFAGFTASKLLWLAENEPDNFAQIAKIMLPKDYLAYRLSGSFCTDYSDASGTLLLDVQHKSWSKQMLSVCNISAQQLPTLHESYDVIGTLKPSLAEQFGLNGNVKVIIGAGDNAAAAIGTGTVNDGDCNISLGTSGTIFICSNTFSADKHNALHSFCHANGSYHQMGCILSAASCRSWWLNILQTNDYDNDEQLAACASTEDLYFLPYLQGERSPHNDVTARGAFIGLTSTTTQAQLSRAVMEGVTFALRDCLQAAKRNGITPTFTNLCGGGAKSKLWRQIVADILNMPVNIPLTEQGPSYGAAILAMVGCGQYSSVEQASKAIYSISETILPNEESAEYYRRKYDTFIKLYPALKGVYQ